MCRPHAIRVGDPLSPSTKATRIPGRNQNAERMTVRRCGGGGAFFRLAGPAFRVAEQKRREEQTTPFGCPGVASRGPESFSLA